MSHAVFCDTCGRHLLTASDGKPTQAEVDAVRSMHRCRPATTHTPRPTPPEKKKEHIMQAVPTEPQKRPGAKELVTHPDRKIARAAQKVLDAAAALDKVWEDQAEVAALKAKEQRLLRELEKVRAEIKGERGPSAKQVRAWAKANGVPCNPAGIIPKHIVDAYQAAQGGAA